MTTEGESCCNDKEGIAKCPKNRPNMCLEKECANDKDHCCKEDGDCRLLRPCKGKFEDREKY